MDDHVVVLLPMSDQNCQLEGSRTEGSMDYAVATNKIYCTSEAILRGIFQLTQQQTMGIGYVGSRGC